PTPSVISFFITRQPHRSPPSPYTTLFRSHHGPSPGHRPRRAAHPRRRRHQRLRLPGHPARPGERGALPRGEGQGRRLHDADRPRDRKSTRLNSSHVKISYAVFCLKKKKTH